MGPMRSPYYPCAYVFPQCLKTIITIFAKQRFGTDLPAATNTHLKTEVFDKVFNKENISRRSSVCL
jgi:hypothetical protein